MGCFGGIVVIVWGLVVIGSVPGVARMGSGAISVRRTAYNRRRLRARGGTGRIIEFGKRVVLPDQAGEFGKRVFRAAGKSPVRARASL
jgi:hypothetical protein